MKEGAARTVEARRIRMLQVALLLDHDHAKVLVNLNLLGRVLERDAALALLMNKVRLVERVVCAGGRRRWQ